MCGINIAKYALWGIKKEKKMNKEDMMAIDQVRRRFPNTFPPNIVNFLKTEYYDSPWATKDSRKIGMRKRIGIETPNENIWSW